MTLNFSVSHPNHDKIQIFKATTGISGSNSVENFSSQIYHVTLNFTVSHANHEFSRLAITKSDERQRRRNAAQQAVLNIDDQIDSDEEIFNDIYADINDFEEISSDPEDSANIDIYSSSDDDDFDL